MMRARHLLQAGAGERGAVVVLFVLWLPVLVLIATFVIDVSNWFVHKKHLQMQADAAALAGAGDFSIPCANAPIVDAATLYSGIAPDGVVDNRQIGGRAPSTVQMAVNSRHYPLQTGPDDPVDSTVIESPPCDAKMIDVKLTEPDVPWFLKAGGVVDFINAHARVSILKKAVSRGALPVAVPEEKPRLARAYFIDEATGEVIAQTDLVNTGTSGENQLWDNLDAPVDVEIDRARIGVRIAVSGSTSLTCGEPLVVCYDLGGPDGLAYIRGYSMAEAVGTNDPPRVRDVQLVAGSCPDPYFSNATTACTIGIRAQVDFGVADPVTDRSARLWAQIGRDDYELTYDPTTGFWERTGADMVVEPGVGPVEVGMRWRQKFAGTIDGDDCSNGQGCRAEFGTVHRTFTSAIARSGSIQAVKIWEGSSFLANSFERCSSVLTECTHSLAVQVALEGSLQNAQDVSDPVHCLRVAGEGDACAGGTSQNQALDCDDVLNNLKEEIAIGCGPAYKPNTGTACPNTPTALWATPQPWDCVALQTGVAVNQVPAGLNLRILGAEKPTTCTAPNNWADFPNLDPSDPRIVEIFLTPFGSFQASGSDTVPITGFANFYITGWTGQGAGFNNPCQGAGDDPVPDDDTGVIVGHFIKYIDTLGAGGGTEACDFNGFGACVAQLTE